jgi:hypothetical protein
MSDMILVYGIPEGRDSELTAAQYMFRRVSVEAIELLDDDLDGAQETLGITFAQHGPVYVAGGMVINDRLDGVYRYSPDYWLDCWRQPAVDFGLVVKVHNVRGAQAPPVPIYDGCVHIWTEATPVHSSTREIRSSTISKLELGGDEYTFARNYEHGRTSSLSVLKEIFAHNKDYRTLLDSSGRLFALVCPFNAYIPINMTSVPTLTSDDKLPPPSAWAPFAAAILEAVASGDLNVLLEAQQAKENARILKEFEQLCMGKHQQRIDETKRVIREKHANIIAKREEITIDLRKLTEFGEVLKITEAIKPDAAIFQEEFSKILEQEQIEKLTIRDDKLVVHTNLLWMDGDSDIRTSSSDLKNLWEGKVVPIGKFEITMNASGWLNMRNTSNSKKTEGGSRWEHPHVPEGGACLGSIESVLPQMLSAYEFGSAAALIIAYLQCCNADDGYGRNIFLWQDDAISKSELGQAATSA